MICCEIVRNCGYLEPSIRSRRYVPYRPNQLQVVGKRILRHGCDGYQGGRYRLLYHYLQQGWGSSPFQLGYPLLVSTNFIIWVGITSLIVTTRSGSLVQQLEFFLKNNRFCNHHNHLVCIQICSNHHPSILRLNQSHHVSFRYQLHGFHLFQDLQVSAIVCPKRRVLMLSFVDFQRQQQPSLNDVDQSRL